MSDDERLDEVPGKRLRYTESIDGMSVTIEADTAAEILELRRAITRDREPNHVRVRREQLAAKAVEDFCPAPHVAGGRA